MSIRTKRQLAKVLSVPYDYIKSKKPEKLLNIYKRCKSGSLPFPVFNMKYTFNNKVYLVPRTKLGKKLYGNVFLTSSPLKKFLDQAASKLGIKDPHKLKKNALKQILTNKMIAMGVPEPIEFMRVKRSVKIIIKKNKSLSPIRVNSDNRGILVKSIVNPDTQKISINKTTTVRYISNKNKKPVNRPNVPKVPNVPNASQGPKVPSVPKVPKVPKVPNASQGPKVPNVPKVPGTPKVPKVPNVPKVPGTPDTPRPVLPPRIIKSPTVPNQPNTRPSQPTSDTKEKINMDILRLRIGTRASKINKLKQVIAKNKS